MMQENDDDAAQDTNFVVCSDQDYSLFLPIEQQCENGFAFESAKPV